MWTPTSMHSCITDHHYTLDVHKFCCCFFPQWTLFINNKNKWKYFWIWNIIQNVYSKNHSQKTKKFFKWWAEIIHAITWSANVKFQYDFLEVDQKQTNRQTPKKHLLYCQPHKTYSYAHKLRSCQNTFFVLFLPNVRNACNMNITKVLLL